MKINILFFVGLIAIAMSGCTVVPNGDGTVTSHFLGQNIVSGYVNTTGDGTPNRSGVQVYNQYPGLAMKIRFEVCLDRPYDSFMHSPRLPLRESEYDYTASRGQSLWIPTPVLVGINEFVNVYVTFVDDAGRIAGCASNSYGVYRSDHWHLDWTPIIGAEYARETVGQEIGGYGPSGRGVAWRPERY